MSDFVLSLGNGFRSRKLVKLLQMPNPFRSPGGEQFDFKWGRLAVLHERFGRNIFNVNGTVVAWVGDLLTATTETFLRSLVAQASRVNENTGCGQHSQQPDSALDLLNGTFGIVIADAQGFSIITDLMNFQQVYMATDQRGKVVSVGTHADLVAKVGGVAETLDLTSLGEFLNTGTPLFPNTVYKHVKELSPGSVYRFDISEEGQRVGRQVYWAPPPEERDGYDEDALAEELREILLSIVQARCQGSKVGVFLSGGLDSRLIMAAVPKSVHCVGLTFSNCPNRETRMAERVAACYNREWILILRGPDYLAECLIDAVRLTGCEYEWTCGQVIGVARDIERLNLDVILEGTLFNDYFKGFCAQEWTLDKQWGGLLPSRYRKTDWDFLDQIAGFWQANLAGGVLEQMRQRRHQTYAALADPARGSLAEWMAIYPFSQDPSVGYWPAERRTMPVRLVAMDRRALDFSFRCPIELKLGSRIYKKAACAIYGRGSKIPDANDGVRPGSGHCSRLAQRAVHELKTRGFRLAERLRRSPRVQTSWHDYQRYWQQSSRLRDMRRQYAANLEEFDGGLLAGRGSDLLARDDLHWQYGFRLLQLGVWREITRGYPPC